jgi:hypothetical protein
MFIGHFAGGAQQSSFEHVLPEQNVGKCILITVPVEQL